MAAQPGFTDARDRAASETITLRRLLASLGGASAELVVAPAGDEVRVSSVVLVDGADLAEDTGVVSALPDLYLHVGVQESQAIGWFDEVGRRERGLRPVAVMSKQAGSEAVRAAARKAGVALVAVHPKARWDLVFPMIQRIIGRSRPGSGADPDLTATDTDLFDLAQMIAANAGGLVSIEDVQSRVLAYSASGDTADELRTLSILGRVGPADYMRVLEQWGVFERLRRSDEVIDVPAHDQLGTRRRLVVGIREPAIGKPTPARLLGFIWVQQGDGPLSADAEDVLRGAAAIAGRIIARALDAPSTEALLIQRLFGARGGGVDVPWLAAALSLPLTGPAAVIGFAPTPRADSPKAVGLVGKGGILRLHASAFRSDSLATIIGERGYVLLPRYRSAETIATWTRQLIEQFEARHAIVLRAAIAAPVPDLSQVAGARIEVDRVLDGTAATFPRGRVTTLAESLTAVLLGEILDLIGGHPELADPRLEALLDYDREHGASLRDSVEAYLSEHGDVRTAAAGLHVHPNTLRYRIRRAEEILGVELANSSDRLLLQLQLALQRRRRHDDYDG